MSKQFDIDGDDEKNGVIGGEMTDRNTVGPAWDWEPDSAIVSDAKGNGRVLGQLSHTECTALRGSW